MKYIFYGCTEQSIIRHICESLSVSDKSDDSTASMLAECGAVAFADRAEELWGTQYFKLPVISPADICNIQYDKIIIAAFAVDSVYNDLINNYNISPDRIIDEYARFSPKMRIKFTREMAHMIKMRGMTGSCAEGGVFRGDYSKVLNECFPDRKLYLFDTFEGFAEKDITDDDVMNKSINTHSFLSDTSVGLVISKLPHPENAIIRKGWFPQTTQGIEDTFAFVCLDFDLYSPIKSGLEWFYPRMEKGGVILVHDYFCEYFDCQRAVDEFCSDNDVYPFPIGDILSVGIIKGV